MSSRYSWLRVIALCAASVTSAPARSEPDTEDIKRDPAVAAPDDFGGVYEVARSCLVRVSCGGSEVAGFTVEAYGRLWLALPAHTSLTAGEPCAVSLYARGRSPVPSETIDDVKLGSGKDVGTPASIRLYDISDYRDRVAAAGIRVPSLAPATAEAGRRLPGSLMGALSWTSGRGVAIDVARVRVVEQTSGSVDILRLDSRLPLSCISMPLLDRQARIAGACLGSPTDPIGPDGAVTAAAITAAIHSELPRWANKPGLESLLSVASKNGFTRLARWRVIEASAKPASFTYDPPMGDALQECFLGAVGDSPSVGVGIDVAFYDCVSESDYAPPGDGARVVVRREAEGAQCTVTAEPGESPARILVLDVVAEGPSTRDLPSLQSLVELAAGPSEVPRHAFGGAQDRGDGPIDPDFIPFPASNPEGPIVRIPLHGDVGLILDANNQPGECFTAHDFDAALHRAAALNPYKVVLDIRSGGGRADAMGRIMQRIQECTAQGASFVAHTGDAGSAAGLIALTCPELLVRPASRIGSAVTILTDGSSAVSRQKLLKDDPELLMKVESFDRAMLANASQSAGRPEIIMFAMQHSAPGLWWSRSGGFTDQKPSDPGALTLDPGSSEVLTLTAADVEATGLGTVVLDDAALRRALAVSRERAIVDIQQEMRATRLEFLQTLGEWSASGEPRDGPLHDRLIELFTRS